MPKVEQEAVERRIDLQIARKKLDALAKSLGLAESTRYVDLFQLSGLGLITRENVNGDKVTFNTAGAGGAIEIPIFDLGETRVRESEQRWLEAVNLLAQKAVEVRSEAREAYLAYRATYEIARQHHREIMPLHAIISDETLRRYNTMIVDVFALLEDAAPRRRDRRGGRSQGGFLACRRRSARRRRGGGVARSKDDKPATPLIAESGVERQ